MSEGYESHSLQQRPDLEEAFLAMDIPWPAFIESSRLLVDWGIKAHRQHQFVTLRGGVAVARSAALPIRWDGRRESLPARGWDGIIEQSAADTYAGASMNTLCALEVGVDAGHEGRGVSSVTLSAMREHAAQAGFEHLIAPVRPSGKTEFPDMPIEDYIARRRHDGLPVDAWLRVHERIGGRVIGPCLTSMTIAAPLDQWAEWTGERFGRTGLTTVEGGIAPVYVNVELDYAVYVEPNVWVEHQLTHAPLEKGQKS